MSTLSPEPSPLRVAFVVHAMQVAGAEVLVQETIRQLGDRLAPSILCLDALGTLGERLRDDGVDVEVIGRRPGVDRATAQRLGRALAARRIELVHAHQYTPFFYTAIGRFLSRTKPRIVLTEHGRHYPDVVSSKRRWVNRWLLARQADAITACCRFSGEALARNDGFDRTPVQVIENGIDLTRYRVATDRRSERSGLGLDPTRRYVTTVARFHPVKDHGTLVSAFHALTEQFDDIDLLLAGDGPLRPDLERQVERLGISDRVQFLGVRDDVPALLAASDLFALTSLSEAASLTLLEAMASELPVVVTDVGGNPEIVTDGVHGRLVPRQDPQATTAAMIELLGQRERAGELGRNGRQRVEQCYRLEDTVERYGTLYATVCGRASQETRR